MKEFINKYRGWLLLVLLAVIIYFPVFLHLDYMPIRMWDESVFGVNAIEMLHNHNYFVTYFYGQPNVELEPPLMIWCIVLFSKILGFSELALRLPAALAATFLCLYLFFVIKRVTGSYVYGFFTVCVLVTCQGYIRNHVTRTGEYDSMLVLFSTVFSVSIFRATHLGGPKESARYIFLFFVFFTLAVLTKGPACLMQLPGLALYVLYRKKLWAFLKNKATYIGLLFFLIFGCGYYALHEFQCPGYLKTVWYNEVGDRFTGVAQGHG